jgi:uncharacterized protein YggE
MRTKLLAIFVLFTSQIALASTPDFPHISTTGYGEIVAKPDMALFTVQVVESTMTAEQAKKSVDKVVHDYVNRLLAEGVEKEDIISTNLHLSPQYHYPKGSKSELVGYKASRRVTVTVHDLVKLDTLLDSALGEGINRIDNIELKVKEEASYRELARLSAIRDANSKAGSLASGFERRLGEVWQVNYRTQSRAPVMMKSMANDSESVSSNYQDATIVISDQVDVIYRLD